MTEQVKPMSIDDLLGWIHDRYMYHAADDSGDARDSAAAGAYSKTKGYIEDNRSALEASHTAQAGKRTVLRFGQMDKVNEKWDERCWRLMPPDDLEEEHLLGEEVSTIPFHLISGMIGEFPRRVWQQFCDGYKITAEFVEKPR